LCLHCIASLVLVQWDEKEMQSLDLWIVIVFHLIPSKVLADSSLYHQNYGNASNELLNMLCKPHRLPLQAPNLREYPKIMKHCPFFMRYFWIVLPFFKSPNEYASLQKCPLRLLIHCKSYSPDCCLFIRMSKVVFDIVLFTDEVIEEKSYILFSSKVISLFWLDMIFSYLSNLNLLWSPSPAQQSYSIKQKECISNINQQTISFFEWSRNWILTNTKITHYLC